MTPIDSHCGIRVSKSIMLVADRYRAGFNPFSLAIWHATETGDWRTLPVANQFSLSVTQKSWSLCVAITCVSVIIKSPDSENAAPIDVRRCFKSSLLKLWCGPLVSLGKVGV